MSRFDECLRFVLEREGGYVNRPEDRGGATSHGVTQATYDDWRVRSGKARMPITGISREEVAAIYRDRYWTACRCDSLPKPLDLVVFDGAVNHGPRQSIRFLQRALGVGDDGIIGPVTIKAAHKDVESGMLEEICADILEQRKAFYDNLCIKDPRQLTFRKGWGNRLTHLAEAIV